MSQSERIYYRHGRHVRVTDRYLKTYFKDEPLDPSQAIKIGRDPAWIAGIICAGLALFAYQFGDLLLFHERVFLTVAGVAVAIGGFNLASLQIGQYMQERTVMWGPVWRITAIRNAIFESNHARNEQGRRVAIVPSFEE